MRVIGGTAKGRKLFAVPGTGTRPILDRVKVPLFDMLRPWLPGKRILDLFAGSGQVGIEAISQGAVHCTFLDISDAAVSTIKKNVALCGFEKSSVIRKGDAFRYLRSGPGEFDLIFIAPPQYKGLWFEALQLIAEYPETVADKGKVIIQIDPKEDTEELNFPFLPVIEKRKYGNSVLIFLEKN